MNPTVGGLELWVYEMLSRERIRDAEAEARRHRMVREVTAGRRWRQLARFAGRRAERARRGL